MGGREQGGGEGERKGATRPCIARSRPLSTTGAPHTERPGINGGRLPGATITRRKRPRRTRAPAGRGGGGWGGELRLPSCLSVLTCSNQQAPLGRRRAQAAGHDGLLQARRPPAIGRRQGERPGGEQAPAQKHSCVKQTRPAPPAAAPAAPSARRRAGRRRGEAAVRPVGGQGDHARAQALVRRGAAQDFGASHVLKPRK